MKEVAGFIAVLAMVAASLWSWASGPCALYSFAPAKDAPARCVMK